MTTPIERTRSLIFALELLEELSGHYPALDVPDSVRCQANAILRHYPRRDEIDWLARQVERDCRYPLLAPFTKNASNTLANSGQIHQSVKLRIAFELANGIVDLDAPPLSQADRELQQKVISKEITFAKAVEEIILCSTSRGKAK
jgi:hypothetical protein